MKTGTTISVDTNTTEGAWKLSKDHFKNMSGTKITQFEGHMAEIMWRSRARGDTYTELFDLL